MAESTTMTIRVPPELKSSLDKLAGATRRSKSFLAAEAIREYVELNEWQIKELQDALGEADAGDFASEEEVRAVMKKWSSDAD